MSELGQLSLKEFKIRITLIRQNLFIKGEGNESQSYRFFYSFPGISITRIVYFTLDRKVVLRVSDMKLIFHNRLRSSKKVKIHWIYI